VNHKYESWLLQANGENVKISQCKKAKTQQCDKFKMQQNETMRKGKDSTGDLQIDDIFYMSYCRPFSVGNSFSRLETPKRRKYKFYYC
jgi:hypothetical protein